MINSSFWMTRVKDLSAYGGDCISEYSVMKATQTIPLVNQVYFNNYQLKLSKEKAYYKNIDEIREAYRDIDSEVDVIHCRGIDPFEVIRKETDKPITFFGGITEKEPSKAGKKVDRDRMMRADAVDVFSPSWKDWIVKDYKVPEDRVHVIPQAVDHTKFKPLDAQAIRDRYDCDILLGYVGSTQETYLRVEMNTLLNKLIRHNKSVMLVIMTYDLHKNKFMMLDREVLPHVMVHSVDHDEMPLYYNAFDITLCLGSAPYAGNMKELECQACGSPTVAFDMPNRRHRFGDDYPYLSKMKKFQGLRMLEKSYDEKDLVDKITYLMDNESERKNIGKKMVEHSKKFSYKAVGKEIMKMYRGML